MAQKNAAVGSGYPQASPEENISRMHEFVQALTSRFWFAPVVLLILSVVAYVAAWSVSPLLDEQFLINWTKRAGNREFPWGDFVSLAGLRPSDLWLYLTPISIKFSYASSFGAVWLWRAQNTLLHAGAALALFCFVRRLAGVPAAWAAAILFTFSPTNVETVAWLGGRGALLSGCLTAVSWAAYLKSREVTDGRYALWRPERAWKWLALSTVSFLSAVFASASVWPFAFSFCVLELLLWLRSQPGMRREGTLCLIAPLPVLFATAVICAATGSFWELTATRPFYILTMVACAGIGILVQLILMGLRRIGWPMALLIPCGMVLLAGGFGAVRSWKQIRVYHSAGKHARTVVKSLRVIRDKTGASYVVAEQVPPKASIAPSFSRLNVGLFDPGTGLLSSDRISGGHLKEALRAGQYKNLVLRWDHGLHSFAEAVITGDATETEQKFDATQLGAMFLPPIEFYKTARIENDAIVMTSNSPTSGPVMRMRADWLKPLGADFVWIDAKIDAPRGGVRPTIEFYWQSASHPEFDFKARRVSTTAFLSDGQFHRYYLPLRSLGWVLAEQPSEVTIGFPAGATVNVTGMGTVHGKNLMPKFEVLGTAGQTAVVAPSFNFPNETALGLAVLPRGAESVPVTFACDNVPDAAGVTVEISMPGAQFEQENSTALSGVTYRTVQLEGLSGTHQIPIGDLPRAGVYAIRAIAMDKGHNMIGNFSDTEFVYIWRPKRAGWSNQP